MDVLYLIDAFREILEPMLEGDCLDLHLTQRDIYKYVRMKKNVTIWLKYEYHPAPKHGTVVSTPGWWSRIKRRFSSIGIIMHVPQKEITLNLPEEMTHFAITHEDSDDEDSDGYNDCEMSYSLDNLPSGLRYLYIDDSDFNSSLDNLPDSVEDIAIWDENYGCTLDLHPFNQPFKKFPSRLKRLFMPIYEYNHDLKHLPDSLEKCHLPLDKNYNAQDSIVTERVFLMSKREEAKGGDCGIKGPYDKHPCDCIEGLHVYASAFEGSSCSNKVDIKLHPRW